MRSAVVTFALTLCLAGCGAFSPWSEQVPLTTVETAFETHQGTVCTLLYRVIDVIADPQVGTVDKATGEPLLWPTGYTAWRAGTEVEVRDPAGKVVLTTGGRYWMSPSEFEPNWVVCMVRPCPDCELGGGPL